MTTAKLATFIPAKEARSQSDACKLSAIDSQIQHLSDRINEAIRHNKYAIRVNYDMLYPEVVEKLNAMGYAINIDREDNDFNGTSDAYIQW